MYTDNKPLTLIFGKKSGLPVLSTSRIQRWAIKLSAYTYEIKFKPSTENMNADALSRLVINQPPRRPNLPFYMLHLSVYLLQLNRYVYTPERTRY